MPNWEHYVSTSYGISEKYYGGEQEKLAETGKENKCQGDMCRHASCLIITQLEKEGLGLVIESPYALKTQQKIVVSFVDDIDLVTDGDIA